MSVLGLLLLSVPAAAPPVKQEWGAIKGQVVFSGEKIPDNAQADVRNDRKACLAKGPILKDELVIDPKTKGVRWVLVWLAPVKDFRKMSAGDVPVRPSLKEAPKEVEVRIPCCYFDPRVLAVREGTSLTFKNDATVAHAVRLSGTETEFAALIPAMKDTRTGPLKASRSVVGVCCPIHQWMKGWVGVFPHPCFAVTDELGRFAIEDAPAGKWRLVLWQETRGYFPFRNKDDVGLLIEVKPGKTTDVGKVKFVEVKD